MQDRVRSGLSDDERPAVTVGLRARIKPSRASGFLQPFRKFGETGRPLTVVALYDVAGRNGNEAMVKVQFDVLRKNAKPVTDAFPLRYFWLAPNPLPPAPEAEG